MKTIAQLLDDTMRAARAAQWSAYRQLFGALREALATGALLRDEDLRTRVDMLNAAAPEHDPQGYLRELEDLYLLLREQGWSKNQSSPPQPAIDLRGLQPPEPIMRIFQALQRSPGEPLRVILPHEPVPLYGLLQERGFSYSGCQRSDGGYELVIRAA